MNKITILRYLAQIPDAGAPDVADALDASLAAAGMALVRLVRPGLVSRALDIERSTYYYSLTTKGRERVHYLSQGPR